METLDEIKAKIQDKARVGDYATVGGLAGLAADTVYRIVAGTRQNDKVLQLFSTYLDKRAELEQELSFVGK